MDKNNIECERIQKVYRDRDEKKSLYAWFQPDVRQNEYERALVTSKFLVQAFGKDLSQIKVLDIGCGTGFFLRTLVEWGASPSLLTGTEYLEDRLQSAERCSPRNIEWCVGGLDGFENESFSLIVTNTVFSSILDEHQRLALANEMWRLLKPGGRIMVFDFRYNNPKNPNVRKVSRKDLYNFWQNASDTCYQTMLLAPPVARVIMPKAPILGSLLSACLPMFRSHFIFMCKKEE